MELDQQRCLSDYYGSMVIDDEEMYMDSIENRKRGPTLEEQYHKLLAEYKALGLSDAGDKEVRRYAYWWEFDEPESIDDMFSYSKCQGEIPF